MRGYLFLISVDAFDDLRGTARNKVIIHKLRGEVSLLEQSTIEYVSVAYFKFMIKFFLNCPQKLLIIGPIFLVLPIGPKPAQISISVQ